MGSWGNGIFESDDAKDCVADIIDEFVEEIEDAIESLEGKSTYLEYENAILVLVSLIEVICQKAGSAPPERNAVIRWKKLYLEAFDKYGPEQWLSLESLYERRKEIIKCFQSLIEISVDYSDEE